MVELKNCENCRHRKIRRSRGYPCMCCELLNPISFNSKWEEELPKQGERNEHLNQRHKDAPTIIPAEEVNK